MSYILLSGVCLAGFIALYIVQRRTPGTRIVGIANGICGGIGTPAADGLEQAGIELYTSINGDTDRVIEQWLKGALPHIIATHKHGGEGCCHN